MGEGEVVAVGEEFAVCGGDEGGGGGGFGFDAAESGADFIEKRWVETVFAVAGEC